MTLRPFRRDAAMSSELTCPRRRRSGQLGGARPARFHGLTTSGEGAQRIIIINNLPYSTIRSWTLDAAAATRLRGRVGRRCGVAGLFVVGGGYQHHWRQWPS